MERLLSRPVPSPELEPYWQAFAYLSRDRPREQVSLGLAGGLSLTRPIPVDRIRTEGERLGYTGDALEDYEAIVVGIDDVYVEHSVKREAAEAKAAAAKTRTHRTR
jgi:hypothetical protein